MKTQIVVSPSLDRTVLGASLAIMLMAGAVLGGWHAHIRAAVQIFPGLIPMQYNTALCFLALGAAGIGLTTLSRMLMLSGGSFAALMGAAVVLEYATGISFGIDTLFFYPWERSLSADPGRMALTTAFSFVLTGSALIILALRRGAYASFGIVNSITLSLALISLVGYAFQVTYVLPFSLGSQMALHTTAAFLSFSIAMLIYAWKYAARGPDGLPKWSAGIGVTLLPMLLVAPGALFPAQSWRAVLIEVLLSIAAIAVLTLAIVRVRTAKVAYKGLLIIAMPLILLLIFVALVVHVKRQSESAEAWARHSAEVLDASQSLLAQITEAESAVRGYVVTSDETFADAYAVAAGPVTLTVLQLRKLVEDNPSQQAGALRIEQLTAEKMARLADTFELVKTGNKNQAEERIKLGTGSALMLRLRTEMKRFSRQEEDLGAERRHTLDATWQRLSWLLVSGVAAGILLSSILTMLFSSGISRRLQQLRDNAVNLAAGNALTPALAGRDEIAELDRVFHAMATSLDEVTRREKVNRILESQLVDIRHADALLKAEALKSAIFNSVYFSSIATDAKGVIQIFNVGAEHMFGYSAAEVVGKITPAELHDPEEGIARAAALSHEFATPIAPGFEALVFKASRGIEDIYDVTKVRKDGSRFPAVLSVTSLRDTHNVIIGFLLIGTDTTARHKAEEERIKLDQSLRDQHFYTRSLIESNIDAMMTTDPNGVITDVNKQTEALTGCTRDELIGAPFKNYFTDAGRAEAGIQRVMLEGKITNYELTARARDGKQTVVSYNATTFHDRDRKLQGVFAAARDVTELKHYEQTLLQKNVELEHASRMKSEFLANMSHELRTPLNAIIGFSEALTAGLIGDITDRQRGFIGDIYDSGKHLLSLINDILDLSKVEAGKMLLDLESVEVSSLLANSLSIVREKAALRQIRLDMDAPEEIGAIQADPRKLKQILYNLLSNAVKFSGDGGQVTLRAGRVSRAEVGQLSGSWKGRTFPLADNHFENFFKFSVIDSGIGISPEGLQRLFKPFSQIDGGLARKFEGTGLGLAMVRLLTELHGGSVAVESAEGEGSCFTVWLPLRAMQNETLTSANRPAGSFIEAL